MVNVEDFEGLDEVEAGGKMAEVVHRHIQADQTHLRQACACVSDVT